MLKPNVGCTVYLYILCINQCYTPGAGGGGGGRSGKGWGFDTLGRPPGVDFDTALPPMGDDF